MSNVGVLKLLSLLYCLFCIFDSLETLTECVCVYGAYLFVPENPNIIMSTSIQYAARIWKKLAKIASSAVLLYKKNSGSFPARAGECAFNCCDNYRSNFVRLSKCSREGKQPLVKQQSLCSLTTQFDTPLSQNRWRCWGTDQFLTVCTWLPWEASRLFSCVTPVSFLWMLRHDSTFMYSVFANILNSDAHRNILFGEYNVNLIVGPQTPCFGSIVSWFFQSFTKFNLTQMKAHQVGEILSSFSYTSN